MPRGRFGPRTSLFIKEYLLEHGEASITDLYTEIKNKFKDYQIPSIHEVATMFYLLKRLGLIEKTREFKNENNRKESRYVIVKDKQDSSEWGSPYVYVYPNDYKYSYVKSIKTKKPRKKTAHTK